MASENETVADIVKEMVEFGNHCAAFGGSYSPDRWDKLCKRIESAHRREVAELDRKVHEHHLAFLAERARHSCTYKDERIRAQDAEIATLKCEVAELRECLKEAIDLHCGRLKCEKGVCFYTECGKEHECTAYKWRKALEGVRDEGK